MKRRKATKVRVKQKNRSFGKKWYRGKIDRGTIFIVVIMITLMFCGYIFVGGTIPETIPKPRADGIVSLDKSTVYKPEQGLQMHTFYGVTNTPYPTAAPPVQQPNSIQINEVPCAGGITGTAKPQMVWAYRISSTPASGNTQAVQVFYSGSDTLGAGTTAMTKTPTDHIINPPVNAGNRDPNGFPVSPALFITDISANANDTAGDAPGGAAQFPSDIYGAWRVENGLSGTVPNNQTLGAGADLWPPANGPGGPRSSAWTAQIIWKVPNLRTNTGAALAVGKTYRMQIILHAGTQNKEIARVCTNFTLTSTAPGNQPPPATIDNPSTNLSCSGSANTPTAPVTGYRLTKCEDFTNGLGAFSGYNGGGGSTVVGRGRVASQCTVANGILSLTQNSDGATCGGTMNSFNQRFGYWEVKMRTFSTGGGGSPPHPVLILWPDTNVWADGELDYFESDLGDNGMGVFLHCIGNPSQNCYHTTHQMDIGQWHVYGFEWTATGFKGFVDGQQIYSVGSSGANPNVSMHQTIQLDNLSGRTPVSPGKMEVDWVHMYSK